MPADASEVQRIDAARAHRPCLARLPAGGASGPAVRLSRARALPPARRASASTRNKLLLDPYARNIVGSCAGTTRCSAIASAIPTRDLSFDRRDCAPYMPRCKVIDPAFTWGDDRAARHAVARHGDLRDARARLHDAPSRRAAARCAAPTPGWRRAPVDRPPEAPRRDHRRAAAGARVRRRPPAGRAGPAQLLGLQHDRLLRARTRATARPARSASSRRW